MIKIPSINIRLSALLLFFTCADSIAFSEWQHGVCLDIVDYASNPLENVFKALPEVLVKKFEVKGYYPIRISITNNSNRFFSFSRNSISLPLVSAQYVAEEMLESSSIWTGLSATGTAAFISLLLCSDGMIEYRTYNSFSHMVFIKNNPLRPYLKYLLLGSGGLGILTYLIHHHKIQDTNAYVVNQIRNESLIHDMVIAPGERISKLVFVRVKNYYDARKKFKVTLNQSNEGMAAQQIIFNVDLN